MSHAHISTLPDLGLLKIFDKLPLMKLLQINQVSPRWDNLRHSSTCRRRSLTLKMGYSPNELITNSVFSHQLPQPQTFNSLSYATIVKGEANWITSTLPNVKHLVISADGINASALENLVYLIGKWTPKLVSVRLYIRFATIYTDFENRRIVLNIHKMFQLANQMPQLKCLLIDTPHYSSKAVPFYFPVLSQLNEFYFNTLDSLNFVYNSLKRFSQTNYGLKKICFGDNGRFDHYLLQRFLGLEPKFASRFAQLTFIYNPGLAQYELNRLCGHFARLNSLTLFVDDLPLSQLTKCLANLKMLTNLGLAIDFRRESRSLNFEDLLPQNEFSTLSSVIHLKLHIRAVSHQDLNTAHLGVILPNLETVTVTNGSIITYCQLCGAEEHDHRVSDEKLSECWRHLFDSFKQCQRVTKVVSELYSNVLQIQ